MKVKPKIDKVSILKIRLEDSHSITSNEEINSIHLEVIKLLIKHYYSSNILQRVREFSLRKGMREKSVLKILAMRIQNWEKMTQKLQMNKKKKVREIEPFILIDEDYKPFHIQHRQQIIEAVEQEFSLKNPKNVSKSQKLLYAHNTQIVLESKRQDIQDLLQAVIKLRKQKELDKINRRRLKRRTTLRIGRQKLGISYPKRGLTNENSFTKSAQLSQFGGGLDKNTDSSGLNKSAKKGFRASGFGLLDRARLSLMNKWDPSTQLVLEERAKSHQRSRNSLENQNSSSFYHKKNNFLGREKFLKEKIFKKKLEKKFGKLRSKLGEDLINSYRISDEIQRAEEYCGRSFYGMGYHLRDRTTGKTLFSDDKFGYQKHNSIDLGSLPVCYIFFKANFIG